MIFEAILRFSISFTEGQKEVVKQSPFGLIELIEKGNDLRDIEPMVSEPLSDVSPVFLFDMGVVVLVVSSAPCKLYTLVSCRKVSEEMIIEELRTVIGVESQQRERKGCLDVLYLLQHICFTFTPYSPLFGPTGSDVYTIYCERKHAGHRGTAVSHSVSLQEPLTGFISLVCLYRYLLS